MKAAEKPGRRRRALVIAAAGTASLVVLYIALALVSRPVADHPYFDYERPLVLAHQGGNHLWPDNTMLAFRNAYDMGVDVLEMDVHQSSDGHLVVIHDDTVDRTTNGTGRVSELTLSELQALDAAYNWPHHVDTGEHPYRGQGVRIPTLREVFEAFPDIRMNVEIKQQDPPIVDALGELIDEFERWDRTLVASFSSRELTALRRRYPQAITSAGQAEVTGFFVLNTVFLSDIYFPAAEAFQVPEYSGSLHVLTPRFIRAARRQNLDVHAWTINDRETMQRLLDLGVDGIITDRPDLALELSGRL